MRLLLGRLVTGRLRTIVSASFQFGQELLWNEALRKTTGKANSQRPLK